MIYSYQQKNKFSHLLLDLDGDYYHQNYEEIDRYEEKLQWVKDNIGEHNIKWAVNYGYLHNGQKIYSKDYSREQSAFAKYVRQWCFLEKADAMAFKVVWY